MILKSSVSVSWFEKVIFDREEGTVLNKVDSDDLFWLHVLTVRDSVLYSNKIGHFDCFI